MSCGCSGTAMIANGTQQMVSSEYRTQSETEECLFTKEQAALWLTKVNCVKDNDYYTDIPNMSKFQLNMYIGILISVGNYQGSPCYFRNELEEIENFIFTIANLGISC